MQLQLTCVKEERRVDSRVLALLLGNQHKPTIALIEKYTTQLEEFGKVLFERAPSTQSRTGQRERFVLLNENQSFFLLTMSKNTSRVVALKVALVKAFSEARRAAEIRKAEYLPAYHELHEAIRNHVLDSPNAHWVHANANKELNRISGVQPGYRKQASAAQQSILAVSCMVAANALANADDGTKVHACIRSALQPIEAALAVRSEPKRQPRTVAPC